MQIGIKCERSVKNKNPPTHCASVGFCMNRGRVKGGEFKPSFFHMRL